MLKQFYRFIIYPASPVRGADAFLYHFTSLSLWVFDCWSDVTRNMKQLPGDTKICYQISQFRN